MEQVEYLMRNGLGVTDDNIIQLAQQVSHVVHVPSKAHLYWQGDPLTEIAFLIDGMFRFYTIGIDGKEHTECFCDLHGFAITPMANFDMVLPINIQALEDSTVLTIPRKVIEEVLQENVEIMRTYIKLLQVSVAMHWETKVVLYQYDAEQRYAWFLKRYSGLIDRIPHRYIASFLNITPVTLSRLRKKHKEKEKLVLGQRI